MHDATRPETNESDLGLRTRTLRIWTYVGCIALAIFFAVYDLATLATVSRGNALGPGAWPLYVSAALGIVSAGALIAELVVGGRSHDADDRVDLPTKGVNRRRWLLFALIVVGYFATLPFLGFFAGSALAFYAVFLVLSDKRRYVRAGIYAIAYSILLHVLFNVMFRLRMPQGILQGLFEAIF